MGLRKGDMPGKRGEIPMAVRQSEHPNGIVIAEAPSFDLRHYRKGNGVGPSRVSKSIERLQQENVRRGRRGFRPINMWVMR